MLFYITYLQKSVKVVLSYKFNSIFKTLNSLIFLIVQVTIWEIVYNGDLYTIIGTGIGENISLSHMISYAIISNILYSIIQSTSIDNMNKNFYTGNISLSLTKPYNYIIYLFIDSLSNSLVSFMFVSIPLIIYGVVFYNLIIPSVLNFIIFLLSLVLSYLIYFCLCILCGCFSFWFIQTGPMVVILSGLIKIFSGVWIPLWLFDSSFARFVNMLPFKAIYYLPLSIYIGQINKNEIIQTLLSQAVWLVIFLIFIVLLWKHGQKKIMVQGG